LHPVIYYVPDSDRHSNGKCEQRQESSYSVGSGQQTRRFADDLCLPSETYGDMQTELEDLTNKAEKTGLVINIKKMKALRINTRKTCPFTLNL